MFDRDLNRGQGIQEWTNQKTAFNKFYFGHS